MARQAGPSVAAEVNFNLSNCRFEATCPDEAVGTATDSPRPLSVILQVTRRCDFSCAFCSETTPMPDPSLALLARIRDHLVGVPRIYVSGGEPMLRNDLFEVLDLFRDRFIVGLPTNATVHSKIGSRLRERVSFVNVGLDGPRSVTSRVRGDYDTIMEGIFRFINVNIPISISSVLLKSTVDAAPFACQIADVLGARKLKMILPIPKGNALRLPDTEYLCVQEAQELFLKLSAMKTRYSWKTNLTMTAWTSDVEGYSILVYPDGKTHAWPVYAAPDKVFLLGNLSEEPIETIWSRNPYKRNHFRKYLGQSILLS